MRTGREAAAWLEAQHNRPTQSWARLCLSGVRQSFGVDYVGNWPTADRNAGTAWDRATIKHRETNPLAIPPYVPVFFETPGAADHVVLSLPGGMCWTNDFVRPGKYDRAPIRDIAAKWGPLLGWTEDLVGNRVVPSGKPVTLPARTFFIDLHPKYQEGFDFGKAIREGIRGFVIKVTEGSTVSYGDRFDRMWVDAKAAIMRSGVPCYLAVYHWVRQSSPASLQVANVMRHLPPLSHPDVWLDVEKGSLGDTPKKDRVAGVVNGLRAKGLDVPGLYLPRWYWEGHMGKPPLRDLDVMLWNSAYGNNVLAGKRAAYLENVSTAAWEPYAGITPTFLQFGSRVQVGGWAQGLDCNVFRGTRAEFRALLKDEAAPEPTPEPEPPKPEPTVFRVGTRNVRGTRAKGFDAPEERATYAIREANERGIVISTLQELSTPQVERIESDQHPRWTIFTATPNITRPNGVNSGNGIMWRRNDVNVREVNELAVRVGKVWSKWDIGPVLHFPWIVAEVNGQRVRVLSAHYPAGPKDTPPPAGFISVASAKGLCTKAIQKWLALEPDTLTVLAGDFNGTSLRNLGDYIESGPDRIVVVNGTVTDKQVSDGWQDGAVVRKVSDHHGLSGQITGGK